MKNKLFETLSKMNFILTKEQKMMGIILIIMSFLGAVFETIGVGIILPFANAMINIDEFMKNDIVTKIVDYFDISNSNQFLIFFLGVMIIVFLIKNLYFMFLSWFRIFFSCKIEREISCSIMRNVIQNGYLYFVKKNTGEIIRDISTDASELNAMIYQLLRVVADVFMIILVGIYIFYTDHVIAIGTTVVTATCLLIIGLIFKNGMKKAGIAYNLYTARCNEYIVQMVQSIKEIVLLRRQDYFCKNYEVSMYNSRKGKIKQTTGMEYPAYIIEAVCVTGLLVTISFRVISFGDEMSNLIPVLSVFAIGTFRILPSLGRISSAANAATYYSESLNHVYNYYREEMDKRRKSENVNVEKIEFNKCISACNLNWKYNKESNYILKNVDIYIEKGKAIGIVGSSGSGKTTLISILLGIIIPERGKIIFDEKYEVNEHTDLSKTVGYVPQICGFLDASIKENVAFGIDLDQIDDNKVMKALEMAQLYDFVTSLPEGMNTRIGEGGVRMSGGQRQRVAIARALYNDPDILVFDEATASLDYDTEAAVMEALDTLYGKKTLIIVAHRLETIRNCDIIYQLKDSALSRISFEEIELK